MSQLQTISLAAKQDFELRMLAEELYYSTDEFRLMYFSSIENAERLFCSGIHIDDISTQSKILSKLKLLKALNNDLSSKKLRLKAGLACRKVSESNLRDFEHLAYRQKAYFSAKMGFEQKTTKSERLKSKFLADAYALHSIATEKGMRCALLTDTLVEPIKKKFWNDEEGVQHIISGKESSDKLVKRFTKFKDKAVCKRCFGIRFLDIDANGNMHLHVILFYYHEDEDSLCKSFYKTMKSNGAGRVEFKTRNENLVKDSNKAINYLAKKFDDEEWLAALSRSNAVTSRTYQLFGINLQTSFFNALVKNVKFLQGVSQDLDALSKLLNDKTTRSSYKKYIFITQFFDHRIVPVKARKEGVTKELVGVRDKLSGEVVKWKDSYLDQESQIKQRSNCETEEEVTEYLKSESEENSNEMPAADLCNKDEVNVSTIKVPNERLSLSVVRLDQWAASVEHSNFLLVPSFTVDVEEQGKVQFTSRNAEVMFFSFVCSCVVTYWLASLIRGPPNCQLFIYLTDVFTIS